MTLCKALKMLAIFAAKVTQGVCPQQLMEMQGIWSSVCF